MSDDLFWRNRIVESGAASPEELVKGMNPLNWRGHPESQREALEEALDSIGVLQPVLFNKTTNRVIDGHLRIELALFKGQPLIPVNYVELTEDEEALALATLDAITEQAEPIPEKLAVLMDKTREMVVDKPGLRAMMERLRVKAGIGDSGNGNGNGDSGPQVDRAEELQKKWQVKPGDIFQLGENFVICGDCRESDTWKRLLGAAGVERVHGVFTSPPYAEQRKNQYGGVPTAEYVGWWEAVQENVRANLVGDGSFFVNIKPHCEDGQRVLYVFDLVLAMVRRWGWRFVDELCWRHDGYPGRFITRFKNQFEPVYQFTIGEMKFFPYAVSQDPKPSTIARAEVAARTGEVNEGRKVAKTGTGTGINHKNMVGISEVLPGNCIYFPQETHISNAAHVAPFPLALPAFFIKAYSDPGDSWLDPFLGSGTTIMAAHNEGRRGFGIERLEKYVSVVLERWVMATGEQPILMSS